MFAFDKTVRKRYSYSMEPYAKKNNNLSKYKFKRTMNLLS